MQNVTPQEPINTEKPTESPPSKFRLALDYVIKNKELFAMGAAVMTTLAGAMTWSANYIGDHVATKEEVSSLDCLMNSNLSLQLLPTQIQVIELRIEGRRLEQSRLRARDVKDEDINRMIIRLEGELVNLETELKRASENYDAELAKARREECAKKSNAPGK